MSRTGLATRRRTLLFIASAALALTLIAVIVVHQLDRQAWLASSGSLRDPLRIEIERDGVATLVLLRPSHDAAWRIVAPCPLAVTAARLTPLLQAVNSASARYPAGDVDLAGAGLTAPVATLVLDGERLDLGGTDLGEERRYLRAGDVVELVPEWILSLVQGGMTALAVPAVFERNVVGIRTAAGVRLKTDIDAWAALQSLQIVDWPLADAPPIKSRESLVVTFEDDSETALELTRTERFDALVASTDGCARLLAPGALPVFAAQDG